MERLSNEPLVVLDGAHNTHAMNRLVENLKKEKTGNEEEINKYIQLIEENLN